MAAVTRRQYKGAAAQTTTTNALSVSDTSVTLTAVTGFPSTPAVPFFVVIDPGTSSEEKCLATISGSTLTLVRAQDDTTASTHTSGATIYPVFTADEADEANLFTSTMTTRGDLLTMGSGPTVARLGIGASGTVLKSDGTDASWATIAAANIASDAVTTAKIQDLAVTGAKIANETVSTKTNSYTLVAADRNTRVVMNSASATTITVNTSLFSAGDTLILQNIGAGVCTVTAGTATVSTAGSLAIPQNGSGVLYFTSAGVSIFYPSAVTASASGLVLVATATPTAVASVSINNCFTSTYENYRIIFSQTAVVGAGDLSLRLRASATDTTTNYTYQLLETYSATYSSSINIIGTDEFYITRMDTPLGASSSIDIYRPQVAAKTSYTAISIFQNTTPILVQQHAAGIQTATTQFDGFTVLTGGTSFTGTIRVYGYSNS